MTHNHLPGKYSTATNLDAVIEIAQTTQQACPCLYMTGYWGIRSSFLLLYGDSIFEERLTMEAGSTGDYPALFCRDAATLTLDQGVRFVEFIPPANKDSLGVWVTDTSCGNSMRREHWQMPAVIRNGGADG